MSVRRPNVAFIHWGAWGDLYVSSAALREVVDEFKDDPIYIIGSQKWTQIIDPKDWPSIKGILATDDGRRGDMYLVDSTDMTSWKKTGSSTSVVQFCRTVKASFNIRTESFRFAWAPFLGNVPRRHGSAAAPWSMFFYTHRAPWLGKDPVVHERDRMLQVIEAPDRIGELARKWSASTGLPRLKSPNQANAETVSGAKFGRYWLINPTSSRREKAWPSEKFRELFALLQPLLLVHKIELKIMGAPVETPWLNEVVPSGFDSKKVVIQPPKIGDLLDVLGGAEVLITNTSSVQFLSPGLNVKTVTLMGRANPVIWGPLGKNDVVIRGTSNPSLDQDIFLQEQDAYRSIEVSRVLEECRKLLS